MAITVNLCCTGRNGNALRFVEEMTNSGTAAAIRNMAANMAFMIKSIRAGKEHFGKPDVKHTQFFNFTR